MDSPPVVRMIGRQEPSFQGFCPELRIVCARGEEWSAVSWREEEGLVEVSLVDGVTCVICVDMCWYVWKFGITCSMMFVYLQDLAGWFDTKLEITKQVCRGLPDSGAMGPLSLPWSKAVSAPTKHTRENRWDRVFQAQLCSITAMDESMDLGCVDVWMFIYWFRCGWNL